MLSQGAYDRMMRDAVVEARRRADMRQTQSMQFDFRGNNARLVRGEFEGEDELLLVGAAGTGKTVAILHTINQLCWTYPRIRVLIVRKVRADLSDSVLATFERHILGEDNPICAGRMREGRRYYRYPNGSEIVVGGMDRPGRILSAEYDLIFVNEAVQLTEADWETLIMRNRATVLPFRQVIGDTNPDRPDHWLKQRADAGLLKLVNTYHEDNPLYYDVEANEFTQAGADYVLGKLERLTGVRKLRYKDGKWVIAEGAIYDGWREDVHVIPRIDVIPKSWWRFLAVDFGYNNPFVCQWWAVDGDGRMYLYREIYMTRRLVEDHGQQIKLWNEKDRDTGASISYMVCDHDAEGVATLEKYVGIKARRAEKAVLEGIQAVQSRLRVEDDGKPRIFIMVDALVERDPELAEKKLPLCTKDEMPGYVWNDRKTKEEPVKENDHGADALRYAVQAVDGKGSGQPVRAAVVRRHAGRRGR